MLLLVARRGNPVIHTGAHQGKVPNLFVSVPYFVPVCTGNKTTKQITASGIGAAFLRNTAKPLFFLISFPLSFLFQCLTHTEKA